MKQILMLPLLPLTILLLLFKKTLEVMMPLAESIGNGVENIINDNYHFWKEIWLKITKTILNKKR